MPTARPARSNAAIAISLPARASSASARRCHIAGRPPAVVDRPCGDCRSAGDPFQTPAAAARAQRAVGFDNHVADVATIAGPAVDNSAAEYQAAADARRHHHAEHVVDTDASALPVFGSSEADRVVVQPNRQPVERARPSRWRNGNPRQPGIFSGDTSPAGHAIGPPQPTPTAVTSRTPGSASIAASKRRPDRLGVARRAGVGVRVLVITRPSAATMPTAIFVPPMSMASTEPSVMRRRLS